MPSDKPIESVPAADALANAQKNEHRRYPRPDPKDDRLFPLAQPENQPSFKINKNDTIFAIGSCFARSIEGAMEDVGFSVLSRSADLGEIGKSAGWTGNFFNKYSIHSILNELTWSLNRDTFPGEKIIYRLKDHEYIDLQLGLGKLDHTLDTILDFRTKYLDYFKQIIQADVIVLTLGYVETWFDKALGIYLNTAPPAKLVKDNPDRFEFRVLSYQDVMDGLKSVYDLLNQHRSKPMRMLITVSPVPLASTFRDMDVLVANSYSKSVQRAAIDQFVLETDGVDYFPSYETVVLSDPKLAWTREDYRHVSHDLVVKIMGQVLSSYTDTDLTTIAGGTGDVNKTQLLANARMMKQLGKWQDLYALLSQHDDVVQTNADLLVTLSSYHRQKKEFEAAFECLERAKNLEPRERAILERMIKLTRPLGQMDKAKTLLKEHAHRFPVRHEDFKKKLDWLKDV